MTDAATRSGLFQIRLCVGNPIRRSAVGLLLALFWLLAACQSAQHKPVRIGFSQRTMADNWRRTMLTSMQLELSFHPDIEFIVKDANGQSARQAAQIQELI